jgi:hypothetical protein
LVDVTSLLRTTTATVGRYGIPLTFYRWSDSIPDINGVTQLPKLDSAALAVDIAVAIATATFVAAVVGRRPRAKQHAA